MPEYPCPSPITVDVRVAGGSLELTAEARETAHVEVLPYDDSGGSREAAEQTRVEFTGDRLVIVAPESGGWALRWRVPRIRVQVAVPSGSSGRIRVAAADTECRGEWAEVNLGTASGKVNIDQVTGDVNLNTASGRVRLGQIGGRLSAKTASGNLSVQRVGGAVDIKTASGDVQIDDAETDVKVKSASGDVRVGTARRGDVRVTAVSGDVAVGVAAGTGVWMDLHSVTGRTRSDLSMGGEAVANGHQLSIQARAVSGSVDVYRATPPAAAA